MPLDRAQLPIPSPPDSSGDPMSESGPFTEGTYFLGRYRVVDEIGVGGMASVHLSRMDGPGGFQKWVAIKRIHPHLVEDETFVNMFFDEARVAARISHPNVATVFELGKHEDTYWIAMEYLHGEPLREVMRRTEDLGQPMPPEIACRVIADAAEGLHAAHELLGKDGENLGLVHRDVTPHNLFVSYDGNTKVVDFGIAKFSSRMVNTRAGTLKGKLAYMSPEQVAGEAIDRRTDVFALGVVLWELTTGQRLFRMESDLDTLAKVQECNVPRPSSIVAGYPIDLEMVVLKALAKSKSERYATSREFSRALQSLLMRRGVFIASDEVASYMTSIFGERIQKREAHLRWAAEVTHTVDVDKIKGSAAWPTQDGSILTHNSDVQTSQPNQRRPSPPRPAAGAPASQPSSGSASDMAITGRAPDMQVTLRPGTKVATVPRASAPVPRPKATPPAPPTDEDLRGDDVPTMAKLRGAGDFAEDDSADVGDTIVSDSMPDMVEFRQQLASSMGQAAMAPGRAAMAPVLPALGLTMTQAASPSAMAGASAAADAPATPRVGTPSDPLDGPIARTIVVDSQLPYVNPGPSLSNDYAPDYVPSSAHPATLAMEGLGAPDMRRLFAPPPPARVEQHTVVAQVGRRRVPVWAVAVGSALLGLAVFALVVLLLRRPAARVPATSADSSAPASGARGSAPSVGTALAPFHAGPFVSARAAFSSAIAAALPSPTRGELGPAPSSVLGAPPPGDIPPQAIPTTNIASLPSMPIHGAPGTQHPAPSPPSAAGGTLKITCVPACDQVLDNGTSLGPSPIVRRAPVGSHRIKLVWSDASKVVSTVVMADQTANVRESHP